LLVVPGRNATYVEPAVGTGRCGFEEIVAVAQAVGNEDGLDSAYRSACGIEDGFIELTSIGAHDNLQSAVEAITDGDPLKHIDAVDVRILYINIGISLGISRRDRESGNLRRAPVASLHSPARLFHTFPKAGLSPERPGAVGACDAA
jgi:hypothetical protein